MKQLIVIVLLAVCGIVQAQFEQENWARECTDNAQYFEAYSLWNSLASESVGQGVEHLNFARQAVFCAEKSGLFEEAFHWSKQVVLMEGIGVDDCEVHFRLMKRLSSEAERDRFIGRLNAMFPDEELVQGIALSQEIIRKYKSDTSDCRVLRLRPQSKGAEYAATRFADGLVFMTSAVGSGMAPLEDAWTGRYFTELRQIQDLQNPEPHFSLVQQLRGEDLFLELGIERTHHGPVDFDSDEDFAVITRNQSSLDTTDSSVISRLELEFYWKRESGWEPAQPFPWNSPLYSCGHAVFDLEANVIFTSDMPGGFGGMDLYISRWENDDWSKPENLGPAINSSGNELFPVVSEVGNLYFATDGWPSAGGLDLYVHPLGSNQIERLEFPINGQWDDFAFITDERTGQGWLSSNRQNMTDALYHVDGVPTVGAIKLFAQACDGSPLSSAEVSILEAKSGSVRNVITDEQGKCELYGWLGREYVLSLLPFPGMKSPPSTDFIVSAAMEEVVLDVSFASKENSIVIVDENSEPVVNALLKFEKANGQKAQFVTDPYGRFEWSAPSQSEDYVSVMVTLINYEDQAHAFEPPPPGCLISINDTLQMSPWDDSIERIDLKNIFYDLGSSSLRSESKLELSKLVEYMKDKPEIRVELSSHTDCRDDQSYNLQLSQSRAENCVKYIITKGISETRIIAKGYGESRLLNVCSDTNACGCAPVTESECEPCSEEMHQANRRTELRLLAGNSVEKEK